MEISTLLKCLKKDAKGMPTKRAQAITPDDLVKINNWLTYSNLHKYEKAKYLCMFALAFYCWFRMDEIENLKIADVIKRNVSLTTYLIF